MAGRIDRFVVKAPAAAQDKGERQAARNATPDLLPAKDQVPAALASRVSPSLSADPQRATHGDADEVRARAGALAGAPAEHEAACCARP
jgi:hypothetical protein